jgi:hypothetical protein
MAVMSAIDVHSREDFSRFVRELSQTARDGDAKSTNLDLPRHLEALSAWTNDMPGYFANETRPVPEPEPSWALFAMILEVAATYE